jgi:hypothetical protein
MSQTEVRRLICRLHDAQEKAANEVMDHADFDRLGHRTPDGFTVNDTLRMWVHHFWSHHRDLVLAPGRLVNDNPHFHVPHYVREANLEFGRFIGELACLTDEQLDLSAPDGGRSIREVVEHVLGSLEGYLPDQIKRAEPAE